jgi:UDP-glucose 4-epimerase
MKIFITGVAGFIGSNLAESLLQEGHEIVGFDNLSQGDLLNMASFASHPRFKFIKGDVLDGEQMTEAAKGCDVIYHLAAFKIPRFGNAYDTLHINAQGTQNAIDAAVIHQAHLIFSSTSDVYGKNPNVPFSEEHDLVIGPPTVKRWAYALSKAFDEQMCFAEAERRNLKFTIVRFFGGYGPNQNLTWWGGPQSVFINNALDNIAIPVHGEGLQTRSFTYVADHVEGLKRAMLVKEGIGHVFNLGNDREITIVNLAKMIWEMIRPGTEPKIEFIPYATFGKYEDVVRRVPDITKSKNILGFQAKWSLEEGLPKTIEWQKTRRTQLENNKSDSLCISSV